MDAESPFQEKQDVQDALWPDHVKLLIHHGRPQICNIFKIAYNFVSGKDCNAWHTSTKNAQNNSDSIHGLFVGAGSLHVEQWHTIANKTKWR